MWIILIITFAIGGHYSVVVFDEEKFASESDCMTYVAAYHKKYPAEKEPITTIACAPAANIKTFIGKK